MSGPSAGKITLRLLDPVSGQAVQQWEFEARPEISIGRAAENDVVVGTASVSRLHAQVVLQSEAWQLVSLGKNGTLVDGERVGGRRFLRNGALIQLGPTGPSLEFVDGAPAFRFDDTITGSGPGVLAMPRVDEEQKRAEVEKITGDESFQDLLRKAEELRRKAADNDTTSD